MIGRAPGSEARVAAVVSVHSFHGGTGKANTTANVAAPVAVSGKRVGVIGADIQLPGIHVLFGIAGDEVTGSLEEFLWRERAIGHVALDVTEGAGEAGGRLFLISASVILPADAPDDLSVWAHRVSPDGQSTQVPATVDAAGRHISIAPQPGGPA
jgi:MinD-like ATPase involved in chromosome partitioning or flagellar assembly